MTAIDAYVGDKPIRLLWTVVCGDDASIDISLMSNGNPLDMSGWAVSAKATDSLVVYDLSTSVNANVVTVIAPSSVTSLWVDVYRLKFEVQVTKTDTTKWTPVVGYIVVEQGV